MTWRFTAQNILKVICLILSIWQTTQCYEELQNLKICPVLKLNLFNSNNSLPNIFVGILIQNSSYTLPYFLQGLEIQNYPKNHISIHFYLDHTTDDSELILNKWIRSVHQDYHHLEMTKSTSTICKSNFKCFQSILYRKHVAQMHQDLLNLAFNSWSDFYLSIDPNVILINPFSFAYSVDTMIYRDRNNKILVFTPMLKYSDYPTISNFLFVTHADEALMDIYNFILEQNDVDIFLVPIVNKMYFINLKSGESEHLSYKVIEPKAFYEFPYNLVLSWDYLVHKQNYYFHLDNSELFGYTIANIPYEISSIEDKQIFQQDIFNHLKLHVSSDLFDTKRVQPSNHVRDFSDKNLPKLSKLGLDHIFCINLARRPYRLRRMKYAFEQLGLDVEFFQAVDGQALDNEYLAKNQIKPHSSYLNPNSTNTIKYGDIGYFLSHYSLWKVNCFRNL